LASLERAGVDIASRWLPTFSARVQLAIEFDRPWPPIAGLKQNPACHGKGIAMQQLDDYTIFRPLRSQLPGLIVAVLAGTVLCASLTDTTHALDEPPALVSADGSAVPQEAASVDSPEAGESPFAPLIQKARDGFQPITTEQLNAARADLDHRLGELEKFVHPGTANGQKWLSYLRWDTLQNALSAEGQPQIEPVVDAYRRLNRNVNGVELPPFRRAADALRRYLDLVTFGQLENPQAAYARQLDVLGKELNQYRERPTARLSQAIGTRLDFLAGLGQSPELVTSVRHELSRPNAFVSVSEELLNAAAGKPIDRSDPVTDVILGTQIRGTSHTTGSVSVRTVPADDRAMLELVTAGRSVSENVGRNGPAVIRSTGYTDYTANKTIELADDAFRAKPAQVSAHTNSDPHSVSKAGGGLGQRFVSGIGWNRLRQSKSRADAIASDHAEERISRRINDEVNGKLSDARKRYQDEYRKPLARLGELPESVQFHTEEDRLMIEVTQASRSRLGAAGGPPEAPQDRDLVLRLHESAINNYAGAMLGGATASETEPGQTAKFDVELPDWMKRVSEERETGNADGDATVAEEPFESYSLTLHRNRPLTVEFVEGQVKLTIHIARLTSGGDEFTNWDVTGVFTPELKEGGAVLHREGELVVLPTGFDTEGGQLSSRQVAVRSNLTKVLNERSSKGRGFPLTTEFPVLEPTGELSKVGPLELSDFTSSNGWLTLAWNRR
jgi:hypothetical protein